MTSKHFSFGSKKSVKKVCNVLFLWYVFPIIFDLDINVPIIPGIMPIQTYASFQRLTKLTGAKVPDRIQEELNPISVRGNSG